MQASCSQAQKHSPCGNLGTHLQHQGERIAREAVPLGPHSSPRSLQQVGSLVEGSVGFLEEGGAALLQLP